MLVYFLFFFIYLFYLLHFLFFPYFFFFFFFNDPATTEIYPLSLHDALPIPAVPRAASPARHDTPPPAGRLLGAKRSEEHTSELQSRRDLVCRLLLEKKKMRILHLFHRVEQMDTNLKLLEVYPVISKKSSKIRCKFFFFNDTATTEIYTLSLHDALPISLLGAKILESIRFLRGVVPIVRHASER